MKGEDFDKGLVQDYFPETRLVDKIGLFGIAVHCHLKGNFQPLLVPPISPIKL